MELKTSKIKEILPETSVENLVRYVYNSKFPFQLLYLNAHCYTFEAQMVTDTREEDVRSRRISVR